MPSSAIDILICIPVALALRLVLGAADAFLDAVESVAFLCIELEDSVR